MRQRKNKRSFFDLSDAEKEAAVAEFDHPLPASRFKPLSRKQRLLFERALGRKPGVSVHVREGNSDIAIHFDPDLLAIARAYAAKNRTSLSKMIDRGLRGVMAFSA